MGLMPHLERKESKILPVGVQFEINMPRCPHTESFKADIRNCYFPARTIFQIVLELPSDMLKRGSTLRPSLRFGRGEIAY